jgi:hypothetical protein
VLITGDNIYRQKGASGIKWDDNAASVTFSYRTGEQETRTVWVENQFSAAFKLEAVQAFRLAGLAIEDASVGAIVGPILPAVDALVRGGEVQLLRPGGENLRPEWTASGGEIEEAGEHGRCHSWIAPDAGDSRYLFWSATASAGGRRLSLDVRRLRRSPQPRSPRSKKRRHAGGAGTLLRRPRGQRQGHQPARPRPPATVGTATPTAEATGAFSTTPTPEAETPTPTP